MALKFIRYNFNIYKAEFRMYSYIDEKKLSKLVLDNRTAVVIKDIQTKKIK